MSVTSEIISSANYLGSKELGGYANSVIDIGMTPLAELAKYTMLSNKAEYEQRQKDTDAQIKELAKISEISLNDLYETDKEQFIPRFTEYQQFVSEWARKTPKTQAEKLQHNLEYQTKTAALKNDYDILKERAIKYHKTNAEIDSKGLTAAEVELKKQKLNERMRTKDIYKPLENETQFEFKTPKPVTPITEEVFVATDSGNFLTTNKIKAFAWEQTGNQAVTSVTDVQEIYVPEKITDASGAQIENPKFTAMTPTQKEANRAQGVKSNATKVIVDLAAPFNAALQSKNLDGTNKYYDADGKFLADKFETDFAGQDAIIKPFNLIKNLQIKAKSDEADIIAGKYVSKGVNGVIANRKVGAHLKKATQGFDKGAITADQLLLAESVNNFVETVNTEVKETDNAIQREGQAITAANNKMDNAVQWYNARTARMNKLEGGDPKNPKAPDGGSTQTALLFGQHVNNLKQTFGTTGTNKTITVSFEATDPVTAKALGLKQGFVTYRQDGTAMVGTDKDGNGGTPMTIEQQKFNFLATVKGGSKDEAQLDDKFIQAQEDGLKSIFGSTSGNAIWNNWGAPVDMNAAAGDKKVLTQAEVDAIYNEATK